MQRTSIGRRLSQLARLALAAGHTCISWRLYRLAPVSAGAAGACCGARLYRLARLALAAGHACIGWRGWRLLRARMYQLAPVSAGACIGWRGWRLLQCTPVSAGAAGACCGAHMYRLARLALAAGTPIRRVLCVMKDTSYRTRHACCGHAKSACPVRDERYGTREAIEHATLAAGTPIRRVPQQCRSRPSALGHG